MKFTAITLLVCAIASAVAAPQSESDSHALAAARDSPLLSLHTLEKRKGGGGGRGSGGGGRTGGGRSGGYYTGGAVTAYRSGAASPTRGVTPYLLPATAFAFFPGIWLYSVYAYPFPIGYHWIAGDRNLTSNVTCLCQENSQCGCDPTDNSTFLANVLTNGSDSGAPVNTTDVSTIDFGNGTIASYINGTLEESEISPATRLTVEFTGYWIMIATVLATVTLL